MAEFLIKASEVVYYEKIIEAKTEAEAVKQFSQDVDFGDTLDTANFKVDAVIEL